MCPRDEHAGNRDAAGAGDLRSGRWRGPAFTNVSAGKQETGHNKGPETGHNSERVTGNGPPVVCLKDLTFAYNGTPVVERANLDILEGDFAVVVGPNGGGKTTLLRLIAGLLRPTRGQVLLFGRPPHEARARIGYTPQHLQFDAHFPVTALDVVLMGRIERRFGGPYSRSDRNAARRALEEVSLSDCADLPFASLSGGQRQRTLIARALACEPDLLLLDEPMAGVDAAIEKRLFDLLRGLNARMTIIMVSHDLSFVSSTVGSVICVNRTVAQHPTGEVTSEAIRGLYGSDVRIIRHDHQFPEDQHRHE